MSRLGLNYRVALPSLEKDKFIKAVREACRKAMYKAAREFLLAAVPRIPVLTGFARGSLGNLEDIVGKVTANGINTSRKGDRKASYYQKRKYYYYTAKGTRIIRNNITGRQFATKPDKIFTTLSEDRTSLIFKFSVDISYFNYLDRERWHAFSEGNKAFNESLRAEFNKLKPRVGNYIVRREIK